MDADCEHNFSYQGVKYDVQSTGYDRRAIFYHDAYYCEKCLAVETIKLDGQTSEHSDIRYGATPMALTRR